MLVGQNIPQGTTPQQRAEIIKRRVEKLHALVDSSATVKKSVHGAASIGRQVAIKEAIDTNQAFQAAFANFLLHMDDPVP